MHLKRWITGLAALPILIFLVVKGGMAFYGLVTGVALLALQEYYRIVFSGSGRSIFGPIPLTGFILTPMIILGAQAGLLWTVMGLLGLNLLVVALISIVRFKPDRSETETVFVQTMGITYIALPLAMLVLIRGQSEGITWIFFILAIVFIGDTSAYHVGSLYGRHKLCPSVSPGKTLEGSLGGLAGNLAAGSMVKAFFLPMLPWPESLAFFIIAGIAGQIGDLFESQFKRLGNIKDSGVILPGHGGILDRIDALLFVAPVAFLFKHYVL